MSLPPSALYPATGVAYNELETAIYQVIGAPVLAVNTANAYLPLDAGTGVNPSNVYINYGRSVGLRPNRTVPTVNTQPVVGSLVNLGTYPVFVSGTIGVSCTDATSGAFVPLGNSSIYYIRKQAVGQNIANASIISFANVDTADGFQALPFNCVLEVGESLSIQNSVVITTANSQLNASLQGLRATSLYGNKNTLIAPYIPA
jgi:hypothetical protein